MSVIVNGSPTKPFKMEKGLRQGDLLSSFLFVLAVEVLNKILNRAVELELIKGINIGRQGATISHLQFADDTILLFAPSNKEVWMKFRRILDCFGVMSGLTINYEK